MIPGESLHRKLPAEYHARDGVAIPKRCAAARQPSARQTVRRAKASRSREAILPSNRRSSRYVELGGLWNPAANTLLHDTFGRVRSNPFLCQSGPTHCRSVDSGACGRFGPTRGRRRKQGS